MFKYAQKNHVSNPIPLDGDGVKYQNNILVMNCMKCSDLHRKIMFPWGLDWEIEVKYQKYYLLGIAWNVIMFLTSTSIEVVASTKRALLKIAWSVQICTKMLCFQPPPSSKFEKKLLQIEWNIQIYTKNNVWSPYPLGVVVGGEFPKNVPC